MLYYELSFIKHSPLFVFMVLLLPALSMICFKFFFDGALRFGFNAKYRPQNNYIEISNIPDDTIFLEYGPPDYEDLATLILQ